jgi:hypothetical protein
MLNLTLKDIDSPRNVLRLFRGKVKNQGKCLYQPLIISLGNIINIIVLRTYLFEGHIPGNRYSATSIQNIIKAAATKAGIKKEHITPYFTSFLCYPHAGKRSKPKTSASNAWSQCFEEPLQDTFILQIPNL